MSLLQSGVAAPVIALWLGHEDPTTTHQYIEADLAHQRLRALFLSSQAWHLVPEHLDRLVELLNLQWLLQNRDRTDLKDPVEDLTVRVTGDHNNVEIRIHVLGCFKDVITGSVRQF